MTEEHEHPQLRFFGCILASATHQLNNVFSTTDQVAGLLGDMLAAAEAGAPLDAQRLSRVHQRICGQVRRGAALVDDLNGFAHGVDHAQAEFDLHRLARQFLRLYERFAVQRRVELQMGASHEEVRFLGNPLDCQHALFLALEELTAAAPAGTSMTVSVKPAAQGATIEIRASGGAVSIDESERAGLRLRIEALGLAARIDRTQDKEQEIVTLRLGSRPA